MFKADLIPLDNSRPCTAPLRKGPFMPVASIVGPVVLHWEKPILWCASAELYVDEWSDKKFYKLFVLTSGTVTWGILVIPLEKQNKKN